MACRVRVGLEMASWQMRTVSVAGNGIPGADGFHDCPRSACMGKSEALGCLPATRRRNLFTGLVAKLKFFGCLLQAFMNVLNVARKS